MLTKGGVAEPFSWELSGNALVITPDSPVEYGVEYVVTTTPEITDLAGNPLQMLDSLEGDNSLDFTLPEYVVDDGGEDVRRGPFASTVYPGFPVPAARPVRRKLTPVPRACVCLPARKRIRW